MKRLMAFLMCTLMILSMCVMAEEIDYAGMSDDELTAMIEQASEELASRHKDDDGDAVHFPGVILDEPEYKLTVNDVSGCLVEGYFLVTLDVTAENNSEYDIEIDLCIDSVNEWDLEWCTGSIRVSNGKKAKGEMWLLFLDIDLESFDDIENFEFYVSVWDKGRSLFNLYKSETMTGVLD